MGVVTSITTETLKDLVPVESSKIILSSEVHHAILISPLIGDYDTDKKVQSNNNSICLSQLRHDPAGIANTIFSPLLEELNPPVLLVDLPHRRASPDLHAALDDDHDHPDDHHEGLEGVGVHDCFRSSLGEEAHPR